MKRKFWLEMTALSAVLVVAGWLRLSGLSERGYLFLDEGVYYQESLFHGGLIQKWRTEGWSGGVAYLNDPGQWTGPPPIHAKPGYTLLAGVCMGFLGFSPLVTLAISAACGVLTVFLAWAVGRSLGGPRLGLMGAGLLALSVGHINYSRAGLSESVAAFAFLLALWFYLAGRSRASPRFSMLFLCFLSGLAAGWAFLGNRRLPMLPFLFAGWEWFSRREEKFPGTSLRRFLGWLCGFASVFLAIEFFTRWVNELSAYRIGTYFEQLAGLSAAYPLSGKFGHALCRLDGLAAYPYYLIRLEGWLVFGLAAIGLWIALRRRDTFGVLPGMVGSVWGFFSIYWFPLLRNLSVLWPLLMLMAALPLTVPFERLERKTVKMQALLTAALFALILGIQMPRALAAQSLQIGYPKVVAWLAAAEGRPAHDLSLLTTQKEIFHALTGSRRMAVPLLESGMLFTLLDRGFVRYLVVDYQALIGGFFGDRRLEGKTRDLLEWVEHSVVPAATFPNPAGASEWVEFEHAKSFAELRRFLKDPDRRAKMGVIRVYDLAEAARRLKEKDG